MAASANTGHNFAKKLTNRGKIIHVCAHTNTPPSEAETVSSRWEILDVAVSVCTKNIQRQQAGAFGSHVYHIIQTMPSISSSLTNTNTAGSTSLQVTFDLVVLNKRKMSLQCKTQWTELHLCVHLCVGVCFSPGQHKVIVFNVLLAFGLPPECNKHITIALLTKT